MKNIITLFLSICIILTNVLAQDELATDILAKLSEATKAYTSITIEFDHTFANKSAGINEKNSGTLILKEEQFRIDMEKQLIVNNGTTHWIYLKEMNELTIMDYDSEDENALSPNKLFTVYDENYKYAYVEAKSVNGERMHIIDLFPKESGPIMKIRLTINALKNQISILALYDKNGGVISTTLNQGEIRLTDIQSQFPEYIYTEKKITITD